MAAGEYRWSKLLGAWVGSGEVAARGVPERFLNPARCPTLEEVERIESKRVAREKAKVEAAEREKKAKEEAAAEEEEKAKKEKAKSKDKEDGDKGKEEGGGDGGGEEKTEGGGVDVKMEEAAAPEGAAVAV